MYTVSGAMIVPPAAINDSAVAVRVFDIRGQNGRFETSFAVKLDELRQRRRADQWHIAGHDQNVSRVPGEVLARGQDGMTRSELFFLLDESNPGNRSANL